MEHLDEMEKQGSQTGKPSAHFKISDCGEIKEKPEK
jgi:hypothetical protein